MDFCSPRARRGAAIAAVAFIVAVAVGLALRELAKENAVERCVIAVRAAPETPDPYERGAKLADACSALYAESGCREGYARAWLKETDPSQRSRIMLEGCRDAYCPKLPMPKPALCEQVEVNLITSAATWPDFVQVVLVHDLGAKRAERVLTAMRAASASRSAVESPNLAE